MQEAEQEYYVPSLALTAAVAMQRLAGESTLAAAMAS